MRATLRRCMPAGTPSSGPVHFYDPRYPITGTLTDIFGGYRSKTSGRRMRILKTHDRLPGRRVEVVSEQLCDDIISRLAPSLEAYKGCTLIDVHPGACLWSSKLHDFLKPKRHILMEPEMRYFEPFVKPLLDKPGSTYRHTRLVGAHAREYWNNYQKLLDDQSLVPDRPALMPDDPKLREIDTSILFTGNLWRKYPIDHVAKYVDHTTLLMQHMTYAALTNAIFHRSGLVRMLWWAPDSVKHHILPSNVRAKRSYDMALQMGASITEVAGVARIEATKRSARMESPRMPNMDASILGRVERRMAGKGIETPPGRQMPSIMEAANEENDVHVSESILKTTCTTIEELETFTKDYSTWLKQMADEFPKIKKVAGLDPKDHGMTPDHVAQVIKKHVRYQQSVDGINSRANNVHFKSTPVAYVRGVVTMDVSARLINLEANYAAVRDTNPDAKALAKAHEAILELGKATTELIEAHAGASKTEVVNMVLDDVVSCEAQPETLHRDRRPYDPLQAHPEEFWPRYEIALLDLVPNTPDLSAPGIADRIEGAKVCQELLKHLFNSPALSLKTALERLAPNAAQDLIPEVPAITDARKGGRLDSSKMPVRMLTQEMVFGLVRAFLEWPFRPSRTEMTLAQSGEGLLEEAEGEEGESEVVE